MTDEARNLVTVSRSRDTAIVTLNNPPVNALTTQLAFELLNLAERLDTDASITSIIIRGAGHFSCGADLYELHGLPIKGKVAMVENVRKALNAIANIGKPVLAAITGRCLGGGLELALCADFRLATADAVLGVPEILLGLIPGGGGTQRLPRLIGTAKANDMIYSGKQVNARSACDMGLINGIVDSDTLLAEAEGYLHAFHEISLAAFSSAKKAANHGLADGLREEANLCAKLLSAQESHDRITRFVSERSNRKREKSG